MTLLKKTMIALACTFIGLSAGQDVHAPKIVLEPVGSNPRANKMTPEEFAAETAKWSERYLAYRENYRPDPTMDFRHLGPPAEGRLAGFGGVHARICDLRHASDRSAGKSLRYAIVAGIAWQ